VSLLCLIYSETTQLVRMLYLYISATCFGLLFAVTRWFTVYIKDKIMSVRGFSFTEVRYNGHVKLTIPQPNNIE
jgi:hypothetical protein